MSKTFSEQLTEFENACASRYIEPLSKGDAVSAERYLSSFYCGGKCAADVAVSYGYVLMRLGRVQEAEAIFYRV